MCPCIKAVSYLERKKSSYINICTNKYIALVLCYGIFQKKVKYKIESKERKEIEDHVCALRVLI